MATVPATHTFADGIALSSEMNSYVRDPISFLLKPPAAELTATAAQSINNGTVTAVQFPAETYDSDVDGTGGHDTVTNNTRFTARYAGWYYGDGGVGWSLNVTGVRTAWWIVNGSAINSGTVTLGAINSIMSVPARGKLIYLNVGDYVELGGYQTSGGALNTTNNAPDLSSMSIHWVSN